MGFRQLLERNREHNLLDKNWSSETAWKDEKKWIRDWIYPDYSTLESDNGYQWASLVAQRLKHLPATWETWVQYLGWEDPLEKEMVIYSSTLASCLENPMDRETWWAAFSSLIHFEFIFVYVVRKCSSFILLQVVDLFSQHHLLKRLSLLHCIFLPPLSKIRCP